MSGPRYAIGFPCGASSEGSEEIINSVSVAKVFFLFACTSTQFNLPLCLLGELRGKFVVVSSLLSASAEFLIPKNAKQISFVMKLLQSKISHLVRGAFNKSLENAGGGGHGFRNGFFLVSVMFHQIASKALKEDLAYFEKKASSNRQTFIFQRLHMGID